MAYKPTKEDVEFALGVYNNVVLTQTYNPFQLVEAHQRLFGETVNWRAARQKLFSYFKVVGGGVVFHSLCCLPIGRFVSALLQIHVSLRPYPQAISKLFTLADANILYYTSICSIDGYLASFLNKHI